MRVINDVKWEIEAEAYAEVSAHFLRLAASCGIQRKHVGFFGEVGFPGVSDIDALVVGGEDELIRLRALHRQAMRGSETYDYLFWHEPLWVLDGVVGDVRTLHTLDGLRMSEGAGDLGGSPIFAPRSYACNETLNIAWMIYLLGAVAEARRQSREEAGVGIRLLLLLHKNLCHSRDFFIRKDDLDGVSLMSSLSLRQWTRDCCLRGDTSGMARVIWEQIMQVLEIACREMDAACVGTAMGDGIKGGSRTLWTRRLRFELGERTRLDVDTGRVVLSTRPFGVAKAWLLGQSSRSGLSDFVEAAARCRKAYQKSELEYPFIRVVPVASGGWTRSATLVVNRLADMVRLRFLKG